MVTIGVKVEPDEMIPKDKGNYIYIVFDHPFHVLDELEYEAIKTFVKTCFEEIFQTYENKIHVHINQDFILKLTDKLLKAK